MIEQKYLNLEHRGESNKIFFERELIKLNSDGWKIEETIGNIGEYLVGSNVRIALKCTKINYEAIIEDLFNKKIERLKGEAFADALKRLESTEDALRANIINDVKEQIEKIIAEKITELKVEVKNSL